MARMRPIRHTHSVLKAPFSLFLALRYLQPKRTFVSLINIIPVIGVAIGVWVMIMVISVMTGFDQELRRKVLGFEAHLIVNGPEMENDWRDVQTKIRTAPHVLATAPYVQGPVILAFGDRRATPIIRGIDPELEEGVTKLKNAIKEGALDLAMDDKGQSNKVVIGKDLANELGVRLGDTITVYGTGKVSEILNEINKARNDPNKKSLDELEEMVLPADLVVTGIFSSGRYMYDANYLLVPLNVAQEIYGLHDGVHGLSIRTDEPYKVEEVKTAIYDMFPRSGIELSSWIDLNHQLFDALDVERNVMFFLLLIIVVVAAFSIMNTLITVTGQKTREIGIMKALGATSGQIVWVFLALGMLVDIVGTILGVVGAMLLIRWRNEVKVWLAHTFHIELFPPSIYQFSEIPAEIVPRDVMIICLSAFVICSIAAFIPAYLAARLDPVKALRFE